MDHVVIIPARNEADHIGKTLISLLQQTRRPDKIIVVNDGSTDATPDRVRALAGQYPLIELLDKPDRGRREMGHAVVENFVFGYEHVRDESFTYLSKLDADLIFPAHYFAEALGYLDSHPETGLIGGELIDCFPSHREKLRVPQGWVPGAVKTMRREAYDKIGGYIPTYGWDIIDRIQMLEQGYRCHVVEGLEVEHLRPHGTAEGALDGRIKWGRGAYEIGSHPLFVLGRAAYRMAERPFIIGGVAFLWGYLRAALTQKPKVTDPVLRRHLRREQLYRLFHGNRLPPGTAQ